MSVIFSIVCPTLNEEMHIESIIRTFLSNCPQPSELFVVDAGSTDRTREIVTQWSNDHDNIVLVDNPNKYVSYAFNRCFALSSGRFLALLGAHTVYNNSFFRNALSNLETNECDAVGGPLSQVANTSMGKAIAFCMSTKFGVGGTEFRTSSVRQYVDSVAFAFYRREIFDKIGLFDEQLVRNQDDEFHYRMNSAGLKILMVPEMKCTYYVRETLSGLFKQYFQYGLFKPLVLKKVKTGLRFRHVIPAIFTVYILLIIPLFLIVKWLSVVPLLIYILLNFYFSFQAPLIETKVRACLAFPLLHISYGIGFLSGLRKMFL